MQTSRAQNYSVWSLEYERKGQKEEIGDTHLHLPVLKAEVCIVRDSENIKASTIEEIQLKANYLPTHKTFPQK